MERTLIILKPDALQRGLVGEIISRFEKAGLKIVATKMVTPSKDIADKHYPTQRREFIEGLGNKTLGDYKKGKLNPMDDFGTSDPHAIGLQVQKWLVDFLTSGAVIAIVLEGPKVIERVRELSGYTIPAMAEAGTIRGDHSDDSAVKANAEKRAIQNLIHASGDKAEADFEINLWFSEAELHSY
ncbi:MAG TPA: nucleoside-diphosphate kinase [Candidatus Saccharimonadales bacterium]|nr:nucleoside-diphosphate kinase [Candidatus Saccharimonadales bacterium]